MKKIKINKELADKYIYFFLNRWCLITEWYTDVSKDPFAIKDYENLFITINAYKPWTNTRESENIEKFSGFLFDIDMWKNPWIKKKEEIEKKVLDYYDYDNEVVHIDFVNETKNWFHLISLIKDPKIIQDYEKESKEYKNKYNEMIKYLDDTMDLKIDDWAKKTSQISSIPWSYRYKEDDWWREGWVVIKILRWDNLLEISSTKQRINELPIEDVLEKIELHKNLTTNTLIEDWKTTNWRKINKKENYLNNFSTWEGKEKRRLKWKPFNIVLNYFNNLYWRDLSNYNKTRTFFQTHFWIIWKNRINSSIRINRLLNQNLFLDKELTQENKKYLLSLEFYISKLWLKELKQTNRISLSEFKKFLKNDKIKLTTIKENLVDLNKKLLQINTEEKIFVKKTKLINIEFKKEKWVKFRFQIFPEIKKDTNVILYSLYLYQYLNSNIIKLNISNNLPVDFYLYLNSEFFIPWLDELYIKNTELDPFWFNKNISLRKKMLKNIWDIMLNFDVKKEQNWFIFIKTLKKEKKT